MTSGEMPGRSMARAHLSQLIGMFGGYLRINTTSAPGAALLIPDGGPDGDETESDEQS
ncbi:hypothetical protein [Streptomyces sp. NBC_01601]|uniref:hypothetical protein n=1 Tax=Streptomyces sp. NBC_01601 TaxID=2975892 RepID=UPI002E2CC191|nr:hypothetical protein [Streptomyces sp. NBC_01601]